MRLSKSGYKFEKTIFQQYEEIPEDWNFVKISDIGEIVSGGTPDTTNEEYWKDGTISWFTPKELTNLKTNFIKDSERKITQKGVDESSAKPLPIGTVLLTTRATIGNCAINEYLTCTNQGFQNIICNNNFDNKFLLYSLKYNKRRLLQFAQGTTFLEISKSNLAKIRIPFSKNLDEAKKIASILSNTDSLIQQTQKEIEQTQRLKKGLMQKLLTRGIGHTKFKKVDLGSQIQIEIPECWNVRMLNELSSEGTQNGYAISLTDYGIGFPIVGMTAFFENDVLDVNQLHEVALPEEEIQEFFLKDGDLLFARRSLSVEGAGKCILVSKINKPTIFESSVIRMTLQTSKFLPSYVNYLLNSPLGMKVLTRIKQVVAVSGITSSDLKKIKIPIPEKFTEQQKIASVLSNVDSKIKNLEYNKSKLELLKKGLMQKLLTGQMRVKI